MFWNGDVRTTALDWENAIFTLHQQLDLWMADFHFFTESEPLLGEMSHVQDDQIELFFFELFPRLVQMFCSIHTVSFQPEGK